MNMIVSGVNGSVTLDEAGVHVKHTIFGKTKSIAWADVGGATMRPGTWLARPKFLVLTKVELALLDSGSGFWEGVAGREAADWFIAVSNEAQFRELVSVINARVAHAEVSKAWRPGASVLVAWSDGQRYTGTLGAVEAEKLLVVFPNGSQHWVGRETVSLAW